MRATFGALLGLAPHVLHHIGFLAGAALLTGALGNTILYGVGVLLSIPLLNRLRKRFGSWRAPALGVLVFTGMFALSAFVIGPALSPGTADLAPAASKNVPSQDAADHDGHHPAPGQTKP